MAPAKQTKPLTSDEIYKLKLLQEQEMARLQRQYALLERDRHQFTAGLKLMQLNQILGIFRREHANILTDLEVANCSTKKKEDAKVGEQLQMLLEEHDFFTRQEAQEKKYMVEIESQIKLVQKDVVKLRSQQITDRQHEDRVWSAIKTVEALDNKLEVQMQKFGSTCAELGRLKLVIRGLLSEREIFLKIWKTMIDKLVRGKRYLLDLIEQATIAYDQREEWCSKLQALRLKAHHDFLTHTSQMTELERKEHNNTKLEAFFSVKGQKRIMRDLQKKEAIKREETKQRLEAKKEQYKELMDQILEFTNEPKVKVIATKFYHLESANFSRFSYINDLMEELEDINDKLGRLYMEIDEKKVLHDYRSKTQQDTLERLEGELEEARKQFENSEEAVTTTENHFQEVLNGIEKLFSLCRCKNDPILELLGDNHTINKYNALLYLELIEKKLHYVIAEIYYKNKLLYDRKKITSASRVIKEEKTRPIIYTLDRIVLSNPCPLCFESEMVSDVIETVQKVINRKEAIHRLELRRQAPDVDEAARIHNVSACHLPKSREIMQKRYQ